MRKLCEGCKPISYRELWIRGKWQTTPGQHTSDYEMGQSQHLSDRAIHGVALSKISWHPLMADPEKPPDFEPEFQERWAAPSGEQAKSVKSEMLNAK